MPAPKSRLAAAAASATRRILGADLPKPEMIKMPKAKHQIHVSPTDVIPAGTILTSEILDLAGLDDEQLGVLVENGAVVPVEVLASAVQAAPEA